MDPITNRERIPEDLEDVALQLLAQGSQLTRVVLRQLPDDINATTASVLTQLSAGPRRLRDLAALERVAQPTMTAAVIGMERRGWIERQRDDDDRRAVWVQITDKGRERRRRLHSEAGAVLRAGLQTLTERQAQAVISAAEALRLLVQTLEPDAPPVLGLRTSAT